MAKQAETVAAPVVPGDAPEGTQPYRLRQAHMHEGRLHGPGEVVHLYPDQVERVRAAEVAAGLADEGVTHG